MSQVRGITTGPAKGGEAAPNQVAVKEGLQSGHRRDSAVE